MPQLFQSVLGPPGGLSTKLHQRSPLVSGPLSLAGPQEDTLCRVQGDIGLWPQEVGLPHQHDTGQHPLHWSAPTVPASTPLRSTQHTFKGRGRGPARSLLCLLPQPPSRLPPSPQLPHQAKKRLHRRLENHSQEGKRGHFFPDSHHREKQVGQMTGKKRKNKTKAS